MSSQKTFSEAWYRVADIKAYLHSTVVAHKQLYQGHWWYVLHDPYNNRFFRLPLNAYQFVAKLNNKQSIQTVWQESLDHRPDDTPGQEEVIQLLTQLHHNNLLCYNSGSDSGQLFKRQDRQKKQALKAKLISFMYIRIPLLDPDNFIKKLLPFVGPLFSKCGAIVWLLVMLSAAKVLIDHLPAFLNQGASVIAINNLLLLYLSMAVLKSLHELGHTIVCRYYGGEVHALGVMLLLFTPLPYMDATSSWTFRNRWHRAFVGAAGMIVELFVAAICVFIWAYTDAGIINSIAYNMIFIASVSTLLFNANPLLRFDGYYILSDLVNIPNLYQRARAQCVYLIERYVFLCQKLTKISHTHKEGLYLAVYGVLSSIYRIVLLAGIILFVADQYLILGLIMATVAFIQWAILPLVKLVKYLLKNQRIGRQRQRATLIVTGGVALIVSFLCFFPMPDRFRVPGVVESKEYTHINIETAGLLQKVLVPSNSQVHAKMPLIQLSNMELEKELQINTLALKEISYHQLKAEQYSIADLEPLNQKVAALKKKNNDLKRKKDNLLIRAEHDGIWTAPELNEKQGSWQKKGQHIGTIYNTNNYRFSAIVLQNENSRLFTDVKKTFEVRINGEESENILISTLDTIPFNHEQLPSAAIGPQGGGEVAIKKSDQNGTLSNEPFFQVYAELPN
ncbi:M50 family metallopeptidase, partial [Pseudomonadota bacterium]|nr:M50 family metallopeptidase [Pseudomonadota bacterium]